MYNLYFSTNLFALSAQVAILAQASVICLLVLVNLPPKTRISTVGRLSLLFIWLAVLVNLFYDLPDNLDSWLNSFALFLITTHAIKCAALSKQIRSYSLEPIKSYLSVLLFGVLHHEL